MDAAVVVRNVPTTSWNATCVANLAVPFGPVAEVSLGPARGRAVVKFKSADDAAEAAFNLDGAVVEGAVIRAHKWVPEREP